MLYYRRSLGGFFPWGLVILRPCFPWNMRVMLGTPPPPLPLPSPSLPPPGRLVQMSIDPRPSTWPRTKDHPHPFYITPGHDPGKRGVIPTPTPSSLSWWLNSQRPRMWGQLRHTKLNDILCGHRAWKGYTQVDIRLRKNVFHKRIDAKQKRKG